MVNVIVSDYNTGPPVPAMIRRFEECGAKAVGVVNTGLVSKVSTGRWDLILIHCHAYGKLQGTRSYPPSPRVAEEIRDLQPGIVIVGYSDMSSKALERDYQDIFDDYLSLCGLGEDLYGAGIPRILSNLI